MPIHDVGYRNWKGHLTAIWTRWWVIAEAGILTALKSRWIRNSLIASWIPVLYIGFLVFFFEQTMEMPTDEVVQWHHRASVDDVNISDEIERRARQEWFRSVATMFPNSESLSEAFSSGDEGIIRNRTWCWVLMNFLRYPQGIMTLLVIGMVAPPLIARDVRSRAFLLYYSRPIGRFEYILGKTAVPMMLLMLITLVPALALYCFGVMLSPNLNVIWDTWDIPIRIVFATMVCLIPTCLLAMLFSAMTEESRFAGFAWLATWGLGFVVWMVIYITMAAQSPEINNGVFSVDVQSNWSLVSLYSTIGLVQAWVLGQEPFSRVWPSIGNVDHLGRRVGDLVISPSIGTDTNLAGLCDSELQTNCATSGFTGPRVG